MDREKTIAVITSRILQLAQLGIFTKENVQKLVDEAFEDGCAYENEHKTYEDNR